MANYRREQAWWGLGAKGGGQLGVVGFELLESGVLNAENINAKNHFHIVNAKIGMGLGASIGLCAVFLFNCPNLWVIDGVVVKDWGVNVALGERWSDFVKGLKNFSLFARAAKIGKDLKGVVPSDVEDGRNLLHYVWNYYDLAQGDTNFKIVTLDIPGSGIGAEISAAFTEGKLEVVS
jgi:hypothetical protein